MMMFATNMHSKQVWCIEMDYHGQSKTIGGRISSSVRETQSDHNWQKQSFLLPFTIWYKLCRYLLLASLCRGI